jgi:hypothetical protein
MFDDALADLFVAITDKRYWLSAVYKDLFVSADGFDIASHRRPIF